MDPSLGERELGIDPNTKRTVFVKIGRYGPMAQIGHADDEDKPLFAALHEDQDIKTVELKDVLKLFELPEKLEALKKKKSLLIEVNLVLMLNTQVGLYPFQKRLILIQLLRSGH